jgi:hypothetical protein
MINVAAPQHTTSSGTIDASSTPHIKRLTRGADEAGSISACALMRETRQSLRSWLRVVAAEIENGTMPGWFTLNEVPHTWPTNYLGVSLILRNR